MLKISLQKRKLWTIVFFVSGINTINRVFYRVWEDFSLHAGKIVFSGGGLILSNARLGRWVINMKIFTLIMCHAHYKCIVMNSIPSQLSNKKIRITGSFTSIQNDKPICVYSNFSLYHFSSSDIISSKIWKSKVLVTFFFNQ